MGSLVLDLLKTVKSTFGIGRGTLSMSGLTAARTFTFPDASGTVQMVTANEFTVIPKPSDTSRANTVTTTADPHLTVALAIGTYRVRISAVFSTDAATDYKYKTAFTGTMTAIHYRKHHIAGAAAGTDLFTEGVSTGMIADQTPVGTVTGSVIVELDLTIVVTVAGTFSFDWAQGTTGAQNCTLKAGSYLDYMKVA